MCKHSVLITTECLDKVLVVERSRHRGDQPRRRLAALDQRERFKAATSPAERDALVGHIRQAHVEEALGEAVAAGRLSPAVAASIRDRLHRGEDPHALRRELRAVGVLTRSSATKGSHDEGDSNV